MSNPKVFEFAKEIGMTPLALMDKIKEWHLPVKNHMAELEPAVLETIKTKLAEPEKAATEEKPKKTTARKTTAKKAPPAIPVAENAKAANTKIATAPKAAAKTTVKRTTKAESAAEMIASEGAKSSSVIRRKTKDVEPVVVEEPKAKIISRPEEEPVIVNEKAQLEAKVETAQPVRTAAEETAPVAAQQTTAPAAQVQVTPPSTPTISRKKEVAIGDSGVSSSVSTALPKRNIVGRMDLSRMQAPAGAQQQGGGFNRGPRPPGQGHFSGGFNQRPGPGGATVGRPAGRNIRAGFVAQMPDVMPPTTELDNRRDSDKRSKKFSGGGAAVQQTGISAKEKEQEELLQSFNAVEFRKREMVFQAKKKTGLLNREALKTQITTPKSSKRTLKVNGKMKVGDVALEMGLKATQLIKSLMTNGVMANVNTDLDFDTIALIIPEFGWEAQNVFKTAEDIVVETAFGELNAEKETRPPVVTVMGHVDHGKTSLLDAIRNARVAAGEAGGITQHIGAYSVKAEDGSLITFLDTPGHEAFTAMRARGANATDIAVIVVAADDGMMPQTAEAINHAKAAGVPIIVAVNKIDKPGANPDKIKQQLTELEIVPEEWGGNTIFVEVSALKRTGIDKLLENIKLLAEVAELKANAKRSGTGLVIEAKLEKVRGAVATILVKDGSVAVGQYIVAGTMKGRVKSLMNDKGERIDKVTPGLPAEVLGLEGVPAAGDRFDVVVDDRTAEEVVQNRKQAAQQAADANKKISLEDMFSKVTQGDVKEFNMVLKADVHGSLEAINGMMTKMNAQEVKTKVIHSAVGGITENDVLLAQTAKGIVIGFNVRPDAGAQAKAKQLGVEIRTYSIVYEMMDDIKKAMAGMLAPNLVEKVMGAAEVRNTFSVPKIGTIAGCFVTNGKIQRSNMLRLVRDGKIIYEGKLGSLKRFKDDAKEVAEGFECGIGIENFNDIKVGDTIEAYTKEEVVRELTPMT